jgi:hypothetical protein
MVRHWTTGLRDAGPGDRRRIRRARMINACGLVLTAVVLAVVLVTKFAHGAWIVTIAIPVLFLLMKAIHRHYELVAVELRPSGGPVPLPSRIHAVVLVSRFDTPTLQALAFARAIHPSTLAAVAVKTSPAETEALQRQWDEQDLPVPLTVLDSPYRDITGPVLTYVGHIRRRSPRDVVCVFIPEYVVGHWWEQLLHNQSALRLKVRLHYLSGIMVVSVPWQLSSADRRPEHPEHAALTGRHPAAPDAPDGEHGPDGHSDGPRPSGTG